MPWKARKNGSRYYYRSIREGGRVRTEYVGGGPAGEAAELIDRIGAAERADEARRWRAEREALDAEDLRRAARFGAVEAMVRGALEAAGFRRHDRGEWRRPRMKGETPAGISSHPKPPAPPAEINDVLNRANAGDRAAAARLRELIALDPARMIECAGGNLAGQVEAARVAKLAEGNPVFGVSVPAKLDALRAELGGGDPPPVERLLIERALLCWLDLMQLELRAAGGTDGLTFQQAEYRERLRDRAHRRYISALKSLAVVRRLGIAAVQIAIDKQQINFAAGEPRGATESPIAGPPRESN